LKKVEADFAFAAKLKNGGLVVWGDAIAAAIIIGSAQISVKLGRTI
jgi:hypothetical protein